MQLKDCNTVMGQPITNITDAGKSKFAARLEPLHPVSLTEQEGALLVEDQDHSVLQLGRQVEREARPREPGLRRRNPSCHIVHNVLAACKSQDALKTILCLSNLKNTLQNIPIEKHRCYVI